MIDLLIKQNWLEKSSETSLEELKSVFVEVLNRFPSDRHTEKRWEVTKISEGDAAYLMYDERALASLIIQDKSLLFKAHDADTPRYDDIVYAIRYAAQKLSLAVYSNAHGGARLPQESSLSIDQTYFTRDAALAEFFSHSNFVPRFAHQGMEEISEGRRALMIYAPYYAEHKEDGSIHILNNAMLSFLIQKDDQRVNKEFSYRVADSMHDFAKRYDLGLIPRSFYQNYEHNPKIINETAFDVFHIHRKIFIDPYVWNFDDEHDYRYYQNTRTGRHLMDKVRKGEDLDTAVKRVLKEELQVGEDYAGLRVWNVEFDRDREGVLTPRLKMNVFVHGLAQKHRSQSHDWTSLK
jgi:hypothetical protein